MDRRIGGTGMLALLLAGTQALAAPPPTAPVAEATADARAMEPAARCGTGDDPLLLWPGELEVRAGDPLAGAVSRVRGPFALEAMDPGCVASWRLDPTAAATLDPRSGAGRVATDAADGASFTVIATLLDGRTVTGKVRVVDPAQHPLAGSWRQVGESGCGLRDEMREPADPLRELRFTGAGRFQVTWTPFEGYVDYWGSYVFHPHLDQLHLTVEGGNRRPPHTSIVLSVTVGDDATMSSSTFPRDAEPEAPGRSICAMKFARVGR